VAPVVYSAIASLDGYVNDERGEFGWAAPGPELHAFVNELERPVGTYLYGRRMYEVMKVWETMDDDAPEMREYKEVWSAADKIVYSRTLDEPQTARTTIERSFDADAVRRLAGPVSVGGPTLAAEAFRAGLVDEVHLFLHPIIVGGGTRALPDGVLQRLELVDTRRFAGGVVHLHHRVL
jgi:dihydrofolate reductase